MISRRDFLSSVAAAGVASRATTSISPAPSGASGIAVKQKIKRGVATYSYQEDYFVKSMSLEDVLREMSDIGAGHFELLAEMMVPNFPNPGTQWLDLWHKWIEKYALHPTCYTQFIDSIRTKSHVLTVEEGVQSMLRDIKLAKDLGIRKLRCLNGTPVPIIEATIPHLERENVWMGLELHAPTPIPGRLLDRLLTITAQTDHFGFVPDFSIFQAKPNPFLRDRMLRDGELTTEGAGYIETSWEEGLAKEKVEAQLKGMSAGRGAARYLETVYHIHFTNPRNLLPLISKCRHIHGKTWGLTEQDVDPAIDLTQVIPALVQGGYEGAIATEYEGQRMMEDIMPLSGVEMVRRHQLMLRRALGEI